MRATRQPTEDVLGADNAQCKGPGGAVQSGADESAFLFDQYSDASKKNGRIGDVLDDLEGQYGVEALVDAGDRFGASLRRGPERSRLLLRPRR